MQIICPICKNITTWEENSFRPFCSERCKIIDLGAWADEKYRIMGKQDEEEDERSSEEEL